jgi:CHASE3 domain sensor protein
MRTLLKFLMGMIVLAMIVGIVYYVMQMMSGGVTEEPFDVIE